MKALSFPFLVEQLKSLGFILTVSNNFEKILLKNSSFISWKLKERNVIHL